MLGKLCLTKSVSVAEMTGFYRQMWLRIIKKNTLKLFIKLAQNFVFSLDTGKYQSSLPEE